MGNEDIFYGFLFIFIDTALVLRIIYNLYELRIRSPITNLRNNKVIAINSLLMFVTLSKYSLWIIHSRLSKDIIIIIDEDEEEIELITAFFITDILFKCSLNIALLVYSNVL